MPSISLSRTQARLVGALLSLLSFNALAQQGMGIGTTAPNVRAALEIASSNKGLLIPRLDSVQRTAITAPPQGLLVYQTNSRAGLWYFEGSWQFLKAGNQADNLGNHAATRNLNLGANQLVGNGGTSGVAISSAGAVRVPQLTGTGSGRLVTLAPDGTLQAQAGPAYGSTPNTLLPPEAVGSAVPTGAGPWQVVVNPAGTRAYVVNSTSNNLQVYDVSAPAALPVAVGAAVPTGTNPQGVAVNPAGTRVYVTSLSGGSLRTYDISDPAVAPVVVGSVSTAGGPQSVAVNPAGTRAYVISLSNALQAYDISNPAVAPVAVGAAVTTVNLPYSIAVNPAGTRAYVVNQGNNTLQAYDISNPAATPVVVGAVATGLRPASVAVNATGTRAYVVNGNGNSLQAYDISNPAVAPVAVGAAVPTGTNPQSVALNPAGTRAYVVNQGNNTLQAYDISNPAVAPVATGAALTTAAGPRSVVLNATATRAYVLNRTANTLQTYRIGDPVLLLAQGPDGSLGSVDPSPFADNLGDHTATRNLNLGANQLVGNGGTSGLSISGAGAVAVGAAAPAASAQLEVASTSKGFLPPRLTSAQRDAIAAPDEGLTIFNTTTVCLETYTGGRWRNYCNGNCEPEAVPGMITAGPVEYCTGTPPAIASVTAPTGGLTGWTYQWQRSTDNGVNWLPVAITTATYAPPAAAGTVLYRRVELNPCGAIFYSNACAYVRSTALTTAPTIASQPTASEACAAGVGSILTFSVQPMADATSYVWALPAHLQAVGPTNEATIQVQVLAEANGTFTVRAANACGTGPARTLGLILYSEPPTSIRSNGAEGPYTYCAGTYTYDVLQVPFATSYFWRYTGTGAVISPLTANQSSISITFTATATAGSLQVVARSGCGLSTAYAVPFTAAPAGSAIFTAGVLCPGGSTPFSVPAAQGTTAYAWSYSGTGATITPTGLNTVTVDLSATATAGTLSVVGTNACGTGPADTYDISFGTPAQPSPITGAATIPNTVGTNRTYSVLSVDNLDHAWRLSPNPPVGSVILSTSSRNSAIVRILTTAGAGTYTLTCTPRRCGTPGPVRTMSVVIQ